MAKVAFREAPTLKAINRLRGKYPYAAALLTYVLLERVLKRFVLEHRGDAKYGRALTPSRRSLASHAAKPLADLVTLSNAKFVSDVLCRMTLGDVEEMLKVPLKERSAADRNEVMHSNLYFAAEADLNRADRQAKNKDRLRRALDHLGRVLDRFTDYRLVEKNGRARLVVQPNH